jgi:predicted GNAT family acetyltransferase
MAELRVTRVPAESEYTLLIGDLPAGFLRYAPRDGGVVLLHTEVDPQIEGRGLGATLVRGALDDVRARGEEVVVLCPFARAWLDRHPEYHDLLAETA